MKIAMDTARIPARLAGTKPTKEYQFTRRFMALDWENQRFYIVRDEQCIIVDNSLDAAFKQFLASLDAKEGRKGVIDYWRAGFDAIWEGLYVDESLQYPQLAAMYRLHWDGGRAFDFVFYPEEGRYNGEDERFLFLNGSRLRYAGKVG